MNCSMPGFPVHHQVPELCSNSCSSSRWCHPTISSSVNPFSSCPQSFPASGSFQCVSSLHQVVKVLEFQLQHQSFQWIFRTDFLQDWLVGSPCSPRDSQESSPTPQSKPSILRHSAFFIVQLSHPHMTTGKTIALTRWTFVGKVMSLLFNMLSRLVIAFLPRSKCFFCFVLFLEQVFFDFMAAITIRSDPGAQKNKVCHCFQFSHLFVFLSVSCIISMFPHLFHCFPTYSIVFPFLVALASPNSKFWFLDTVRPSHSAWIFPSHVSVQKVGPNSKPVQPLLRKNSLALSVVQLS